jgi:hypothetical protein
MLEESLRFVIRSEMEKVLELYLSNKHFCGISEDKLAAGEKNASRIEEEVKQNLTYEADIKPLVIKLLKERGKDVVKDVLDYFFVTSASQVKQEDWPEFIAVVKKALAGVEWDTH